jgi:hypothetical protein
LVGVKPWVSVFLNYIKDNDKMYDIRELIFLPLFFLVFLSLLSPLLRKDKRGIEETERRGRKRRKLLDELKERKGYLHLKEEALDRTMWRFRFGRGFGPVVRHTTK